MKIYNLYMYLLVIFKVLAQSLWGYPLSLFLTLANSRNDLPFIISYLSVCYFW
jgi:hypothetical protein